MPAQTAVFLIQRDRVAALGSRDGGVHPAWASADDHDLFGRCRWRAVKALHLAADDGVERTAERAVGQIIVEAGEAAAAAGDIVLAAGERLFRKIGVADRLAGDLDDVRLAGSDDLLHHIRIVQPAQCRYRRFDMLFDLLSQVDVAAVLDKH